MHISSEHFDLFPTRFWAFDLNALADSFAAWRAAVEDMRGAQPQPLGRSNRHGWNSHKAVFDDPRFAPLRACCSASFNHAFGQIDAAEGLRYRFEAWANINDPGSYNDFHVHGGALLSGVFYLTVPEGAGDIVFRDPRPGVVLSRFVGSGPNAHGLARVAPREGLLLVFPSWLEHGVETHEGQAPRVSLAMNAVG